MKTGTCDIIRRHMHIIIDIMNIFMPTLLSNLPTLFIGWLNVTIFSVLSRGIFKFINGWKTAGSVPCFPYDPFANALDQAYTDYKHNDHKPCNICHVPVMPVTDRKIAQAACAAAPARLAHPSGEVYKALVAGYWKEREKQPGDCFAYSGQSPGAML